MYDNVKAASVPKRELILALAIVVVAAFGLRWAYQPIDPQPHIGRVEAESGLDIGSPPALFTTWTLGDGYAFALIAADPSGAKLAEKVPDPAYRFSRAGFGWAAWLLALGRTTLVPYGLALAGLFGLAGVVVLAKTETGPRPQGVGFASQPGPVHRFRR